MRLDVIQHVIVVSGVASLRRATNRPPMAGIKPFEPGWPRWARRRSAATREWQTRVCRAEPGRRHEGLACVAGRGGSGSGREHHLQRCGEPTVRASGSLGLDGRPGPHAVCCADGGLAPPVDIGPRSAGTLSWWPLNREEVPPLQEGRQPPVGHHPTRRPCKPAVA